MMKTQNPYLIRKLRLAGGLIIAGLAVQLGSLFWNHPLSFIVFVVAGSLASVAGIAVYLLSIVSPSRGEMEESDITKSAGAP